MSLRSRLALAFAGLAAVVAALMGVLGYTATTNQLERAADEALLTGSRMAPPPGSGMTPEFDHDEDERQDATLVLSSTGQVLQSRGEIDLPVTDADRAAAASTRPVVLARTASVDATPYRIVTVSPGQSRGAVLLARDWSESAAVLRRLAGTLAISALLLSALAALIGWLVARQITRRLVRLTDAAEQVSATGQLDVVVPGAGTDEVGRLAGAFNTMLGRLAGAQAAQQRLVQDAGHELRTPLTSLRTNISLLERLDELSPSARERVLADLRGESRELTGLVNEVLALSGGQMAEGEPELVALGPTVARVATRARRRTGREVSVSADDCQILAAPAAVERAVWNLVDNAAKFDPTGAAIDIRVAAGTVEVMDRGPGVAAEELPHLFDRFYRPVGSRSLPGSGLGLAIVKDVAEASGGQVFVRARPGGGSVFGISWPPVPHDYGGQ